MDSQRVAALLIKRRFFFVDANCVSVTHNHVRCGFFALETCIGFWLDPLGQSTGFKQSIPDGIACEELMKFALVLSTLAIFTASVATASAQSDTPAAPAPAPARAAHAAMGTPAAADAQKGGKPYFIEFRARSAMSYGHTFAVIGRNGQKLTKANVVGLH